MDLGQELYYLEERNTNWLRIHVLSGPDGGLRVLGEGSGEPQNSFTSHFGSVVS